MKLIEIADALLDDVLLEGRDIKLDSALSIKRFAVVKVGDTISEKEAEKILNACKKWIEIQPPALCSMDHISNLGDLLDAEFLADKD